MKLSFIVSGIAVTRYLPRYPTDSGKMQLWVAFLRNRKDGIAAMDFFAVPTISLKVFYVWFVVWADQITAANGAMRPETAVVLEA